MGGGLNELYWYQIVALDSAVGEAQKMLSSYGGFLKTNNVICTYKMTRISFLCMFDVLIFKLLSNLHIHEF